MRNACRQLATRRPPLIKPLTKLVSSQQSLGRIYETNIDSPKHAIKAITNIHKATDDSSVKDPTDTFHTAWTNGWVRIVHQYNSLSSETLIDLIKTLTKCLSRAGHLIEIKDFSSFLKALSKHLESGHNTFDIQDALADFAWASVQYSRYDLVLAIAKALKSYAESLPIQASLTLPPESARASRNIQNSLLQAIVAASALSSTQTSPAFVKMMDGFTFAERRAMSILTGSSALSTDLRQSLGPVKAHKVERCIQQAELFCLLTDPAAGEIVNRVRRLADHRDRDTLSRLWQVVIESSQASNWLRTHWLETSSEAEGQAVFSPELVAAFIISFLRLDMREQAGMVWDSLESRSLAPTPSVWSALVVGHTYRKDVDSALLAYRQYEGALRKEDRSPLVEVTMIRALLRASRSAEAMVLLDRFRQQVSKHSPDAAVTNRLVAALLDADLPDLAWRYIDSLPQGTGCVNVVTLNTLLAHLTSASDSATQDSSAMILRAQELTIKHSIAPDQVTLHTMLHLFLKKGKVNAAEKLLASANGPQAVRLHTLFAKHFLDLKPFRQIDLDKARSVWQRVQPLLDSTAFTDIIRGLADRATDLFLARDTEDAAAIYNEAHAMYNQMLHRKLKATTIAQNALLRASFARGTAKSVERARRLFEDMQLESRGNIHPASWLIMLLGLEGANEVEAAYEHAQRIRNSSFRPNASMSAIMQRIEHKWMRKHGQR